MLAKVQGLFRLTRDAELKYTPSGMALLKMGLVCSEKYKDKETTLFIDAVAFSKPAEILNQYAGKKGTQLFLTGKLHTESWEDNSGKKRSKVSITVEGFDFVSNKDNSNPNSGNGASQQHAYDNQGNYNNNYDPNPKSVMQQPPQGGGEYINNSGIRETTLDMDDVVPF